MVALTVLLGTAGCASTGGNPASRTAAGALDPEKPESSPGRFVDRRWYVPDPGETGADPVYLDSALVYVPQSAEMLDVIGEIQREFQSGRIIGSANPVAQRERRTRFVQRMTFVALQHPQSPVAVTQAVFAAVHLGHHEELAAVLEACDAGWWCELSRGYTTYWLGSPFEAEGWFRKALEGMPAMLRCELEDVSPILPKEYRSRYAHLGCSERGEINAQVWWLSDPLLVDEGNDRWTEHVARRLETVWVQQGSSVQGRAIFPPFYEAHVTRSWWWNTGGWGFVTSHYDPLHNTGGALEIDHDDDRPNHRGAANHFVPDRFPWSGLDEGLEYRLEASDKDEGYTRPGGVMEPLPSQFARFLEGDSLVVAVAAELPVDQLSETADGEAWFVASPEPGEVRTLGPTEPARRVMFLGRIAERAHLTGIEVISPEFVGRTRFAVLPLRDEAAGPVLSDLLLFRRRSRELPESRRSATAQMLASEAVEADREIGLYWEVYGLPEGTVEVALTVEGDEGGWLSRLGRTIGVVDEVRDGTLTWSEEVAGEEVFARSITLDIEGLDAGDYEIGLRVRAPDGTTVERSRTLTVSGRR